MKKDRLIAAVVIAAFLMAMAAQMPGIALAASHSPAIASANLETNWNRRSGHEQADVYHFDASAGTLKLQVGFAGTRTGPDQVRVVVRDVVSYQIVLAEYFSPMYTAATAELPRAGTYAMVVSPNRLSSIALEAPGLRVAERTVPAVALGPLQKYQRVTAPFPVGAQALTPAETGSLQLTVNDQVLRENALRPDGSVEPFTVDPAALEDGVHTIGAIARSKNSENYGMIYRHFLVDRADAFSDVPPAHWARAYVEVMSHLKILSGRGGGLFAPGMPVTRAEFAKMIALTLDLVPGEGTAFPFEDVPQGWAREHVHALAEAGLIKGESVGGKAYFRPDRTITRAEAVTIVGRALGVDGISVSGVARPFPDWNAIPGWAHASVWYLHQEKWIDGMPDGRFQGAEPFRRDQAAKLLAKFLGM